MCSQLRCLGTPSPSSRPRNCWTAWVKCCALPHDATTTTCLWQGCHMSLAEIRSQNDAFQCISGACPPLHRGCVYSGAENSCTLCSLMLYVAVHVQLALMLHVCLLKFVAEQPTWHPARCWMLTFAADCCMFVLANMTHWKVCEFCCFQTLLGRTWCGYASIRWIRQGTTYTTDRNNSLVILLFFVVCCGVGPIYFKVVWCVVISLCCPPGRNLIASSRCLTSPLYVQQTIHFQCLKCWKNDTAYIRRILT